MPIGKPASEVGDHTAGHLSPNLALSPGEGVGEGRVFWGSVWLCGVGGSGAASPGPNGDGGGRKICRLALDVGTHGASVTPTALR